jgi:HSP20 family protein
MSLTRYTPLPEHEEFPAGLRLFHDTVSRLFSEPSSRPWSPAVDIYETENDLVLMADVPQIELKDIDLQLENGTLTLKGERKFEQEQNGRGYHRIERGYGSFVRAFTLPDSVDSDKVKAEYNSGVLTITLSKKEVAKPKTIRIEISNN